MDTKITSELPKRDWRELFDERQRAEIELDEMYARDFHHGTDGHNARMIIATFAEIMNRVSAVGCDPVSLYDEVFVFTHQLPPSVLVKR